MKNKLKYIIVCLFFLFCFINYPIYANEDFSFDVSEIQILDNGNIIKGLKRGTANSTDGLKIEANNFEYNKETNILNAVGNVKIVDTNRNYIITSNEISYIKNLEKILTKGFTEAFIESKYNFKSNNVLFLRNQSEISSLSKTNIIDDNLTLYSLDSFKYNLKNKILKGKNINIILDYSKPLQETDRYKFKNGIFNLEEKNFIAADTKINLKNDLFNVNKNNPRIYGASSKKTGDITTLNNGVFTSCNINQKCPSWKIEAEQIVHDSQKKKLLYKNALLKIYDYPVLYFPKFFHPDPTVERQSGFLMPQLNDSETLGTSFHIPYYHVISDNKDTTIKPTIFDKNIFMLQNEYRQENANFSLITDIGHTRGFKSTTQNNKKNSITHLFGKLDLNLNFNSFESSKLNLNIEKVNNDTYLKIFDTNLIDKSIKPKDQNVLNSDIEIQLEKNNFQFTSGLTVYENLNGLNSDRYQYILPYYNLYKQLYSNNLFSLNLISSGENTIQDTNVNKTSIVNNFNFLSRDLITNNGIKNKFGFYFKNLNSLGKNDTKYKKSPQSELMSIYNFETSYPLFKLDEVYSNYLEPKFSIRFNPGDMKNYSEETKQISTHNIFSINRLSINDSFESGKSLTLGLKYKKEKIEDINNYFEIDLATSFREKVEENIPFSSSLNSKSSNIFGTTKYSFSENVMLDYNFSLDNNLKNLEYNNLGVKFAYNLLTTKFNFVEANKKIGATNSLGNSTELNFTNSSIKFATRRNREINLTEFYDLVYEYKNDCLTAGIKYKKTYYQDRDVKPNEDLFFTITLYPLTTYEQKVESNLYRN
jgi:LPS-assembly protein